MPTYQYACTECGEPLEVVQSFTDDALTVCPTCGGRLRKLYSGVGIVFKGSGFYRNDSRAASSGSEPAAANGRASAAAKGESGPKSDSGSKTESGAKTDSGGSAGSGSNAKGADSTGSGTTSKTKSGSGTSAA